MPSRRARDGGQGRGVDVRYQADDVIWWAPHTMAENLPVSGGPAAAVQSGGTDGSDGVDSSASSDGNASVRPAPGCGGLRMTAMPAGITGLDRIAQVKLPVTDLACSVTWYRRLLGLRLWIEFVEDGVLRGAGLIDPQGRFNIALRDRAACASQPSLDGFDVIAFLPTSRSVLEDLAARCDRLGIAHSGIYETGAGPRLDVPDPDGTVVRFYYYTGPTDRFTGIEMHDGRVVGTYDTPRQQ
jgi:catechol 2,3-dioxygenase-like lactoylglutathione lyase family enzyme